jgi:predicted acylesterase/phospholipase RssA
LDEVRILPNVRRFAGTSVGSIVAALLAMDCPVSDVGRYMKINFDYLLRGNITFVFMVEKLSKRNTVLHGTYTSM